MTEEQCREILRKEPGDRTGIGIKNVNDRIKIYFGSNYGLNITSELDEGTCVTIRMPKVRRKNMRKSRRKPFIAIGAGVILLAILFLS